MKRTVPTTAGGAQDGRVLRSHRSRRQIIDAVLDLCAEGTLVPTAQQVAQRAGVGIRSVFRHFSDMEALFAEMDQRLTERYQGLFLGGERSGALGARIRRMVEQRGQGFEALSAFYRSTQAQSWSSPALERNYARQLRALRHHLHAWLPELSTCDAPTRHAAEAAASFETWDRLRRHQRLSRRSALDVVTRALSSLLGL